MNKLLSTCAVALALFTSSAVAADLLSIKAPRIYVPPPPLCTGIYGGVNIGGGWTANRELASQIQTVR